MGSKPDAALEDLAQRAYNISINLDGRVERSPDPLCMGGCAVVYKGILLPECVEVAVKTPSGQFARGGIRKVIKDAIREVHAWSKLRHKNVLPLLGITTEFNHTISIVSAWMEKGNAHDYVQDAEVDPRPLIEGIARGLYYLHDYKPGAIYHGDLKGANVLISPDGRALLTDFGFAHVVNSSLKMTFSKIYGGTLNWMAPEIINGGDVSAEGDVWAFGMTILELFTRKIPFPDCRYPSAITCAIIRDSPARPREARLNDDWWGMCTSCWNRQPLLRPQMSAVVKNISLLCAIKTRSVAVEETLVLGISGIEIRNTSEADSAELTIGGKRHNIINHGEDSVIRADFNPSLELPLQDQISLSIMSQVGPGWTRRTDLSFSGRDVLSKSDQHTFRRTVDHLEIILEIFPSTELESPELLIPTTDELLEQCPHFRILLIGKTGVGKTSLIHRTFGVAEARPAHDKRGRANIEKPLVSNRNKRFILHDSNGFEPGENNNIAVVKSFIKRRRNHKDVKEQLHAIWLSFEIPLETYGQRMMETGMEDFLREKRSILGDIPTVFVFTKYDKLVDAIESKWEDEGKEYSESDVEIAAEQYLKKHCIERIEQLTGEYNIPCLAVSTKARHQDRLKELVQLTYQKVSEHFVQQQGNGPSAVSTVTVMAQRVDASLNIAASIKVGKQRYWEAVFAGSYFWGHTIQDCLQVIHTDIVEVWNLCDPSDVLMGQEFRESMFGLVNLLEDSNRPPELSPSPQGLTTVWTPGGITGMVMKPITTIMWIYQTYRKVLEVQHKFMAYIVDLTHVMDILFVLADGKNEQEITFSIVQSALRAYRDSTKRRNVHAKIKALSDTIIGSSTDVVSVFEYLISAGCDGDKELDQRILVLKQNNTAGWNSFSP